MIASKQVVRYKYEKIELIEAAVHRVCMRCDVLIEEDIITSLNRDSSVYANELGLKLRKHMVRDECEAVLLGHRYLDFRSVGDVKAFGRRYLRAKYNPFEAIIPTLADTIGDFFIIRNVLAHYSGYTRRSYTRMMKRKHQFKRLPRPGDYLVAVNSRTKTIRWTEYLEVFLQTSDFMHKRVC